MRLTLCKNRIAIFFLLSVHYYNSFSCKWNTFIHIISIDFFFHIYRAKNLWILRNDRSERVDVVHGRTCIKKLITLINSGVSTEGFAIGRVFFRCFFFSLSFTIYKGEKVTKFMARLSLLKRKTKRKIYLIQIYAIERETIARYIRHATISVPHRKPTEKKFSCLCNYL